MKFLHSIILAMVIGLALTSCKAPKEIAYFQDITTGDELILPAQTPLRLMPSDMIGIQVSTSDPRLDALFNLPVMSSRIGHTQYSDYSQNYSDGSTAPYTIDKAGCINFPVLGKIHVAGMTREELSEYIRRELIQRDLAKNPIVTVTYLNLSVSVLGEVTRPGRVGISREDFSVLDALSAAGDLTIYGQRTNVKVLRQENGVQKTYTINLNSARDLTESPVFFLKQNDVVYVEPNNTKKNNSTPNGNTWSTPTLWISLVSSALSVATLILTVTK